MRTIWKYELSGWQSGYVKVFVPPNSIPRFVAWKDGCICVWMDVLVKTEERRGIVFAIVGTGHNVPNDALYIGSVIDPSGVFVWHVCIVAEVH